MGLVIERWRAVVGFEGRYEVSDLGNVRSVDRWLNNGRGSYFLKGLVLRTWSVTSGHQAVDLGWRSKSVMVHRIVLEAFVGPSAKNTECCHNDGNPANNKLSNLRWGSHGSNMQDIKWHREWGAHKLKPDDVKVVRELLKTPTKQQQIADMFGVHQSTISNIKRGVMHTDVE